MATPTSMGSQRVSTRIDLMAIFTPAWAKMAASIFTSAAPPWNAPSTTAPTHGTCFPRGSRHLVALGGMFDHHIQTNSSPIRKAVKMSSARWAWMRALSSQ